MANRVSNDQLDELLEFLAEHPTVARGGAPGSRSKETVERQWNDLARKLNSFASGSSKSGERWKKYWADIKHKSKTRLAKRRVDARNNGGGPSNQEDLSDIDKKILAIIGKQAVDGDSKHDLPVLYIQSEVQDTATVQPNYIVIAEEVVASDTSQFPEPVASSAEVQTQQVPEPDQTRLESPVSQPQPARSRRRLRHNRTSLNNTSINKQCYDIYKNMDPDQWKKLKQSGAFKRKVRKTFESLKTGPPSANSLPQQSLNNKNDETYESKSKIKSSSGGIDILRKNIVPEINSDSVDDYLEYLEPSEGLSSDTSSLSAEADRDIEFQEDIQKHCFFPKRKDLEWMKELERNRLRAENKMADASLMIAEAAKLQAEASLMNAETSRMNAETNRMNAETNRKQLEVMKAVMDVGSQPSSTCLRAVHQRPTGVSETAVLHLLKEVEGRNADNPQEPPEKRYRARMRSRQTRSSSDADSSDDNDGDNEQSSHYLDEEPEIEVRSTAVNIEPSDIEVNKEQAQTDPISLEVKTEAQGDEVDKSGLSREKDMKAEEIENYEEGFS